MLWTPPPPPFIFKEFCVSQIQINKAKLTSRNVLNVWSSRATQTSAVTWARSVSLLVWLEVQTPQWFLHQTLKMCRLQEPPAAPCELRFSFGIRTSAPRRHANVSQSSLTFLLPLCLSVIETGEALCLQPRAGVLWEREQRAAQTHLLLPGTDAELLN